ncbi:MAG: hypothetical protein KKB81_01980 [Candidatus Margulisbacteria bacterium]|nr:hypothetical protein [Candidatus Margulisiibacteriota bacterium]MBU1022550.1 hypothetical protein [Candidatus Margulisiibacteriota bacterium]MBU1728836.1 hypothetical protein [Candidatus Margulisiibacteriota bacterium]MBU1955802.1 hypothetical protein [Candidatus Margulisiibacteriota bacterium]
MPTQLVKYCPALPRMLEMIHPRTRIKRDTRPERVASLLRTHQMIVISGTNHDNWRSNKQIGKSTYADNVLRPYLEAQAITASYKNCRKEIERLVALHALLINNPAHRSKFEAIVADNIKALFARPFKGVYLLDETHYVFPLNREHPEIIIGDGAGKFSEGRFSAIGLTSHAFWNKFSEIIAAGGKIVFITAMHPYDPSHHRRLFNEQMASFLTAPVVELEHNS